MEETGDARPLQKKRGKQVGELLIKFAEKSEEGTFGIPEYRIWGRRHRHRRKGRIISLNLEAQERP